MANSLRSAAVTQVCCLRAAARVVERYALHGALTLINLGAAIVTDKYRLSRHQVLQYDRNSEEDSTRRRVYNIRSILRMTPRPYRTGLAPDNSERCAATQDDLDALI
jgi:hypothetical protein